MQCGKKFDVVFVTKFIHRATFTNLSRKKTTEWLEFEKDIATNYHQTLNRTVLMLFHVSHFRFSTYVEKVPISRLLQI